MGKQQRLCRSTDDGLRLVRPHLEHLRGTGEIVWDKLLRYGLGHIVVELLVIDTLDLIGHVGIGLHPLPCPVLELLTYLVYLIGAGLRRLLVRDRLSGSVVRNLYCLGHRDGLVLHSGLYKLMPKHGLMAYRAYHAHSPVLLCLHRGLFPKLPCTASVYAPHANARHFLYEIVVQLGVYPRGSNRELDQMGRDIHRHLTLQCLYIGIVSSILILLLGLGQLLPHISAQVLIDNLYLTANGILEPKPAIDNLFTYLVLAPAKRGGDIGNIYTTVLIDARHDSILDIRENRILVMVDHPLTENIRLLEGGITLPVLVALLLVLLKSEHALEIYVVFKERYSRVLMQVTVGLDEPVKRPVQLIEKRIQALVALVVRLIVHQLRECSFHVPVSRETFLFRVPLDLIIIQIKRDSVSKGGDTQFSCGVQKHTSLLDILPKFLICIG